MEAKQVSDEYNEGRYSRNSDMQNYKQVPQWWFLILLVGSTTLSLMLSFVWKEQVQLPWWGMLFAFALAFIITLPVGVIQATTNQVSGNLPSF
jgi:OPT oligopeptide transporter protein